MIFYFELIQLNKILIKIIPVKRNYLIFNELLYLKITNITVFLKKTNIPIKTYNILYLFKISKQPIKMKYISKLKKIIINLTLQT